MSTAINAKGLSVSWTIDESPVLQNLSFRVPEGQRVLVTGPSGAGKSTLLLTLAGALEPLGLTTETGSLTTSSAGLLLQNPFTSLVGASVFREVAFGAENAAVDRLAMPSLVSLALEQVGLSELDWQANPRLLSGGEMQRLCLAGLLTLKPKLLLLDEPTAMLDAASASEVRAAVVSYLQQSKATAVISEHRFDEWLPIVDRVLVLDKTGKIIDDTFPAAITAPSYSYTESFANQKNGRITALVGPSGSGKSTRLKAELEHSMSERKSIGWLPQNAEFTMAGNSVLETIAATLNGTVSPNQASERAHAILKELDLEHLVHKNPFELSGGQQRRLALASAVLHQPENLFLDEPTVGQDPEHWQQIVRVILRAKASGADIWVATHDEQFLALCDEVVSVQKPATNAVPIQVTGRFSPLALIFTSMLLLGVSWLVNSLPAALAGLGVEAIWLAVALILGFPASRLKLLLPTALGIASIGFSNWLLSESHVLEPALISALRVAVFVLPGVLLASSIQTDVLADQLGQQLGLPARPVIAATSATSRLWELAHDWRQLKLVRQIRKVSSKNPITEAFNLASLMFVSSTRGATQTAIAMEARGFSGLDDQGKRVKRTWAVAAKWGSLDWVLPIICLLVAAAVMLWR